MKQEVTTSEASSAGSCILKQWPRIHAAPRMDLEVLSFREKCPTALLQAEPILAGSRWVGQAALALAICSWHRSVRRLRRQGPNFESFTDNALGVWKGWCSPWLDLEKPFLDFTPAVTKVMPIKRNCAACAGVIQGVQDWTRLDRDAKGFVFFDCGSWSTEREEGQAVVATFAVQDGERRRITSCKLAGGRVEAVQVALQAQVGSGVETGSGRSGCGCSGLAQIATWKGTGLQGTSKSVFVSTRVSWRRVSESLLELWQGAVELPVPGLVALKPNDTNGSNGSNGSNGFWLVVGDVHEGRAKLLARQYTENARLESVAILCLEK